jgi:hypothetical protein
MWREIVLFGWRIQAKIFDNPSMYGINEGRISKLWVREEKSGKELLNYERGWDFNYLPKPVVDLLVKYLEHIF